jgi:ketosteroid isomerase-like protein
MTDITPITIPDRAADVVARSLRHFDRVAKTTDRQRRAAYGTLAATCKPALHAVANQGTADGLSVDLVRADVEATAKALRMHDAILARAEDTRNAYIVAPANVELARECMPVLRQIERAVEQGAR